MVNIQQLLSNLDADISKKHPNGIDDFITSDMTTQDAALCSLKKSLVKKYCPTESSKLRSERAIDLWLDMNARCATSFSPIDGSDYVDDILFTYKDLLWQMFEPAFEGNLLTLDACFDHASHGPGKSANVPNTDYVSKMYWDSFSFSSYDLVRHYQGCLNPTWSTAEAARSLAGQGVLAEHEVMFTTFKNGEIDRCCNKQPSLNMFYQKGAGAIIEMLLKRHFNISLSTQPTLNREMARQGSLYQNFGTIDLKSASDTIAQQFVKWSLPDLAYCTLDRVRMSECRLSDGTVVPLHMFSCMGNGFTFPLQTLLFATLMRAIVIHSDLPKYRGSSKITVPYFSVFGDDIVIASDLYDVAIRVLQRCGFIVNLDKSYNKGPFRESCGGDFYLGNNIRGVYFRRSQHETHVYSLINRLTRWSIRHDFTLANTLQYLMGLVKFLPVPYDTGDDAGIKVPRSILKNVKFDENGSIVYKYMKAVSNRRKIQVPPIVVYLGGLNASIMQNRPKGWRPLASVKRSDEYAKALESSIRRMSDCSAETTDESILTFYVPLRTQDPRYQVSKDVTPNWDYIPGAGFTTQEHVKAWLAAGLM